MQVLKILRIGIAFMCMLLFCGCDGGTSKLIVPKQEKVEKDGDSNPNALVLDVKISGDDWSEVFKTFPMNIASGGTRTFNRSGLLYVLSIRRNDWEGFQIGVKFRLLERSYIGGVGSNKKFEEALIEAGGVGLNVGSDWVSIDVTSDEISSISFRLRLIEPPAN